MQKQFGLICGALALCFSLAGCAAKAPAVTPTPTQLPVETGTPSPEVSTTPPVVGRYNADGRSTHSAMEKAGKGIEDSIHSVERNVKRNVSGAMR